MAAIDANTLANRVEVERSLASQRHRDAEHHLALLLAPESTATGDEIAAAEKAVAAAAKASAALYGDSKK
jgi:hypothetical protein